MANALAVRVTARHRGSDAASRTFPSPGPEWGFSERLVVQNETVTNEALIRGVWPLWRRERE
jgi:hypothetical protein